MKATLATIFFLFFILQLNAQKVGVNTNMPTGTLHIKGSSSITSPNLRITDTIDNFARIKMETTQGGQNFWDIATASNDDFSKFNLFYSKSGTAQLDLFSIDAINGQTTRRSISDNITDVYYRNVNELSGLHGFIGQNYHMVNYLSGGKINFATENMTRMTLDATGKLGLGVTSPLVEIDVRTAGIDDGAVVNLSNLDQSHFLRLYSGRENLINPIIYWKTATALQLGLANADDSNYQTFLTLDGKTIGILNTGGSIYMGESAGELSSLNSSRPNLAIGRAALKNSVNRSQIFAIGDSTLVNNAVGATSSTHGNDNMAVGFKALKSNTLGHGNLVIGLRASIENTTGSFNTVIGQYALENSEEGYFNVAIGGAAMRSSESGGSNVAIGYQSLYQNNGGQNTTIGSQSMSLSLTGSQNTVIGRYGMYHNVDGFDNVAIGHRAGYGNMGTSYSGNVLIGSRAGENITDSDRLYIENSNSISPLIYGEFNTNLVRINGDLEYTGSLTDVSDIRLKKNITEVKSVLNSLIKINPVIYQMDLENFPDNQFNKGMEYGLIAQNLEEYFPLLVKTNREGYKSVDYVKLSVLLLKGIQEQEKQISLQDIEIQVLKEQMEEMKKQIQKLFE
jgi:hypothetical protein